MSWDPMHGHAALRRGRYSQPGSTYFLTICTNDRRAGMTESDLATRIVTEREAMEADTTWRVRCATIMPDHMHLVIDLGSRLSLGRAVGRLKARTSAVMKTHELFWEEGCFDRKIRVHEPLLPIFLYIYLNPYRANLVKTGEEDW